jgi:hypothetical protein
LKADFIASLPMRPGRAAPCLLIERYETSFLVSGRLGQTAKC